MTTVRHPCLKHSTACSEPHAKRPCLWLGCLLDNLDTRVLAHPDVWDPRSMHHSVDDVLDEKLPLERKHPLPGILGNLHICLYLA
jgi:hypothetical protein